MVDVIDLELTVIKADGLAAKDTNIFGMKTSSDPYVEVRLCPKGLSGEKTLIGKTVPKKKTLKPQWDQSFSISIPKSEFDATTNSDNHNMFFELTIMDYDDGDDDDLMGVVTIMIPDGSWNGTNTKWYGVPATSANGEEATGRVQCTLTKYSGRKTQQELQDAEANRFCLANDGVAKPVSDNSKQSSKNKGDYVELKLMVKKAEDLVAMDSNILGMKTKSDPYIEVRLCPQGLASGGRMNKILLGKTTTQMKTLNPKYNETFTKTLPKKDISMEGVFELTIWDYDATNEDDLMGVVLVPIKIQQLGTQSSKWYEVPKSSSEGGIATGRVQCSLTKTAVKTDSSSTDNNDNDNNNTNTTIGGITGITSGITGSISGITGSGITSIFNSSNKNSTTGSNSDQPPVDTASRLKAAMSNRGAGLRGSAAGAKSQEEVLAAAVSSSAAAAAPPSTVSTDVSESETGGDNVDDNNNNNDEDDKAAAAEAAAVIAAAAAPRSRRSAGQGGMRSSSRRGEKPRSSSSSGGGGRHSSSSRKSPTPRSSSRTQSSSSGNDGSSGSSNLRGSAGQRSMPRIRRTASRAGGETAIPIKRTSTFSEGEGRLSSSSSSNNHRSSAVRRTKTSDGSDGSHLHHNRRTSHRTSSSASGQQRSSTKSPRRPERGEEDGKVLKRSSSQRHHGSSSISSSKPSGRPSSSGMRSRSSRNVTSGAEDSSGNNHHRGSSGDRQKQRLKRSATAGGDGKESSRTKSSGRMDGMRSSSSRRVTSSRTRSEGQNPRASSTRERPTRTKSSSGNPSRSSSKRRPRNSSPTCIGDHRAQK